MNIKKMIQDMTLEEKASLCSGADFWHTEAVDRVGLKSIMVSDGPYGLRKQEGLKAFSPLAFLLLPLWRPPLTAISSGR